MTELGITESPHRFSGLGGRWSVAVNLAGCLFEVAALAGWGVFPAPAAVAGIAGRASREIERDGDDGQGIIHAMSPQTAAAIMAIPAMVAPMPGGASFGLVSFGPDSRRREDRPVPGSPRLRCVPSLPLFTDRPFTPVVVLMPDLERLTRIPGAILIRFWKRHAIIACLSELFAGAGGVMAGHSQVTQRAAFSVRSPFLTRFAQGVVYDQGCSLWGASPPHILRLAFASCSANS